jgi:hypothetical protein
MRSAARLLFSLALSATLLLGCGDEASPAADSGVCGTYSNPGILTLSGVTPAPGATVLNRNIVHSFTVVKAPANFYGLELVYGDGHTAGVSTPEDPKFETTVSGTDVNYQMIIDGWSNAPGHVVVDARSGYDTSAGCAWVFPSPLFVYDVAPLPVPDGGAGPDSRPVLDGIAQAVDGGSQDGAPVEAVDVPLASDVLSEASSPVDTAAIDTAALDVSRGPDGPATPLDASVGG